MGNPPPAVKLALESICLLLGEQAADWRTIRGVIIKDNFISTVVNFSTEDISYVEQLCLPFTISPLLASGLSIGRLRCHYGDADGNENVKKAIGLD